MGPGTDADDVEMRQFLALLGLNSRPIDSHCTCMFIQEIKYHRTNSMEFGISLVDYSHYNYNSVA
jgi:hypothetical protein